MRSLAIRTFSFLFPLFKCMHTCAHLLRKADAYHRERERNASIRSLSLSDAHISLSLSFSPLSPALKKVTVISFCCSVENWWAATFRNELGVGFGAQWQTHQMNT